MNSTATLSRDDILNQYNIKLTLSRASIIAIACYYRSKNYVILSANVLAYAFIVIAFVILIKVFILICSYRERGLEQINNECILSILVPSTDSNPPDDPNKHCYTDSNDRINTIIRSGQYEYYNNFSPSHPFIIFIKSREGFSVPCDVEMDRQKGNINELNFRSNCFELFLDDIIECLRVDEDLLGRLISLENPEYTDNTAKYIVFNRKLGKVILTKIKRGVESASFSKKSRSFFR